VRCCFVLGLSNSSKYFPKGETCNNLMFESASVKPLNIDCSSAPTPSRAVAAHHDVLRGIKSDFAMPAPDPVAPPVTAPTFQKYKSFAQFEEVCSIFYERLHVFGQFFHKDDMEMLKRTAGSAYPMRLQRDIEFCANEVPTHGLHTNLALDSLLGNDRRIMFSDLFRGLLLCTVMCHFSWLVRPRKCGVNECAA